MALSLVDYMARLHGTQSSALDYMALSLVH